MHSSCHDALLGSLTLPNLKHTHMDFWDKHKISLVATTKWHWVFAQLERTALNK